MEVGKGYVRVRSCARGSLLMSLAFATATRKRWERQRRQRLGRPHDLRRQDEQDEPHRRRQGPSPPLLPSSSLIPFPGSRLVSLDSLPPRLRRRFLGPHDPLLEHDHLGAPEFPHHPFPSHLARLQPPLARTPLVARDPGPPTQYLGLPDSGQSRRYPPGARDADPPFVPQPRWDGGGDGE